MQKRLINPSRFGSDNEKSLDGNHRKIVLKQDAEVVKLVDAVDSKSTTSNGVPVRFRPSVPLF